jgi:hypothetical protein
MSAGTLHRSRGRRACRARCGCRSLKSFRLLVECPLQLIGVRMCGRAWLLWPGALVSI